MRGQRQIGDKLIISAVAGTGPKSYDLAPVEGNCSYETVSLQPEVEPDQPLVAPLNFAGGIGYSRYDPETAGYVYNSGLYTAEPNVIGAPRLKTDVTLTSAAAPPMYFFTSMVSEAGHGQLYDQRLHIISVEADEMNVYMLSLHYGDSADGTGVTTTNTTLTDTREAWTTNEWVGEYVTCNAKEMKVTSNTATVLTGASWSMGGNPGDGNAWIIEAGPFGTLKNIETFSQNDTQPTGRPIGWFVTGQSERMYIPTGDNGKIQRLDETKGGTTSNDYTASGDSSARQISAVGDKLYKLTGNNQVKLLAARADPMTDANWTGTHYVGKYQITSDIGELNGEAFIPKADGFFRFDAVGSAANMLPTEMGIAEYNGQGFVFYEGGWMIPCATCLFWTRTGKGVGPDSNPRNTANVASLGSVAYFKHGRWMGLATYGDALYGLYVDATGASGLMMYGRLRAEGDPPGWGPLIWQCISTVTANTDDFRGCFVTHVSQFKALDEYRPTLWCANDNDVSYWFLDKDGKPISERGAIDLGTSAKVIGGAIDFGYPRVDKQYQYISGHAEDFHATTGHSFQFKALVDGGAAANVGAAVASGDSDVDGYWERFFTQDSGDTGRSFLPECEWTGSANLTNTNGPRLENVQIHAIAKPRITRNWTFLVHLKDDGKTAKLERSQLEGFVGVLKKFKMPDGDSFNGILTSIEALRADKIGELKPRKQPPPKYVFVCKVRELPAS